MLADPYNAVEDALTRAGLTAQRTRQDQLVVSSGEGSMLPAGENSFWLSQIEGTWYLSTWLPVCYRVPPKADMVSLCLACIAAGTSAMCRVPPEISSRFGLQEIDERQFERLFPTEGDID
jgi:hypothetical protein